MLFATSDGIHIRTAEEKSKRDLSSTINGSTQTANQAWNAVEPKFYTEFCDIEMSQSVTSGFKHSVIREETEEDLENEEKVMKGSNQF